MIRNTLAVLSVLALAATAQAEIIISAQGAPTDGLSGFTTYTVTAVGTAGEQIQGFDFAGDGSNEGPNSAGFYGAMNQVNPFTLPTIFQDNNATLGAVGSNPTQDSQFLFKSSDVVVPSGFAEEGPNILQAIFAASAPLGTSVPFAQIVIPNASAGTIDYVGKVSTADGGEYSVRGSFPGTPVIPEPATLTLFGLAIAGFLGFNRRK